MNREIKYIAQDEITGDWVSGFPLRDADVKDRWYMMHNYSDGTIVNPETIRQYTGMKDKNGVEIYKGDITKWCNRDTRESGIGSIEYNARLARFEIRYSEIGYMLNTYSLDFEVIGNIYEHPELLTPKPVNHDTANQ